MTIVMRPSCLQQNFGPNGLSAPSQGLCLNFFSSITADFNISSALRWAILDHWSSGFTPQGQSPSIKTHKNIGLLHNQIIIASQTKLIEPRHDKTNKVSMRPAKTQISLGFRAVWSESSLCAQWVAKDPSFLHVDSADSDQTGRMPSWSESSLGAHSFCWFSHVTALWLY